MSTTRPGRSDDDQLQPPGSFVKAGRRRPVPNVRGREKKEHILEVAKQHFSEQGYRGASTAAIADEAGITDPGLLHHFQTKRGLLMALLESRLGHDMTKFAVQHGDTGTEILERLSELVEENTHNLVEVRLFSVLLAESVSHDHPGHDFFAHRFQNARSILSGYLAAAQDEGKIRADTNVEGLAAALLAVMDGLQYQWLLDPDLDMKASFDVLIDLVGRSLVVPPSAGDADAAASET